jgi:hypothetical protein
MPVARVQSRPVRRFQPQPIFQPPLLGAVDIAAYFRRGDQLTVPSPRFLSTPDATTPFRWRTLFPGRFALIILNRLTLYRPAAPECASVSPLETLFRLEIEFHRRLRTTAPGTAEASSLHTSYALQSG